MRRWFERYRLLLAMVVPLAWSVAACEQGSEGNRCNPDLVDTSECNSGLSCVTPPSCVVSVCCPSQPPYTDPQCECFADPRGAACGGSCSVDAAYDTGAAPSGDAGKDATHE
jgi:hypothetical protein